MLKDQIKKQLLSMGERAGQSLLKSAENKGAAIGERIQNVLGEQVEKVHDALEKETVTDKNRTTWRRGQSRHGNRGYRKTAC